MKQFQLAYFSNIDQSVTDAMPIHEFNVLYKILIDQLEREKESIKNSSKTKS